MTTTVNCDDAQSMCSPWSPPGAEKAANEHDLAKSRNVNKQQREDEEATTRKVGMHSELRGSSSIARESKQRNMTRTPTCAKLKKHNKNNKLSES